MDPRVIIYTNEAGGVTTVAVSEETDIIHLFQEMKDDITSYPNLALINRDDLPNEYSEFFNAWEIVDPAAVYKTKQDAIKAEQTARIPDKVIEQIRANELKDKEAKDRFNKLRGIIPKSPMTSPKRAMAPHVPLGDTVIVNIDKAREITKERLRQERIPLLAAQDVLFQIALETGADTTAIVAEKNRLRNITDIVKDVALQNLKFLKA